MTASMADTKAPCRLAGADPIIAVRYGAEFPKAVSTGAVAVKVTTHAIEQRCPFRVLARVDHAPEEEPVGRLIDAIGQLAFNAHRCVSEDRERRSAPSRQSL